MKFHKINVPGEYPPKWYGLGYTDFMRDERHYFVMPLHLFVRILLNLWILFRYLGGNDRVAEAYRKGFQKGQDEMNATIDILVERKIDARMRRQNNF